MKLLLLIFGMGLLLLPAFDSASAQAQDESIRVDDPSFDRQGLQTGEAITPLGSLTVILIEALGAILIVLFIIVYAIKKRAKGDSK